MSAEGGSSNGTVGAESGAKIVIETADGEKVVVAEKIARMWGTIDTMLKDLGTDSSDGSEEAEEIPIQKVSAETLRLVIEWCEHYEGTAGPFPPIDDEFADLNFDDSDIDDDDDPQMKEIKFLQNMKIPEWDKEWLKFASKPNPVDSLLDVIEAANYLNIEDLLNLTCKTVGNMMSGKSPEQIREIFGIENDYTPEEEEQLRKEIAWCEGIEAN